MKKISLFLVLALCYILNTQSQEVRFAVKIGPNFSSVAGDGENANGDLKVGFHFGGVWDVPFSTKFSLQPEALISREVYEYGIGLTTRNVNSTYLRIPILAKYNLVKGFSVEAGPSIGLLIASKVKDYTVRDNFKTVDAAASVGASYEMDRGLFFSARYNLGLTNMNNIDGYNGKNQGNNIQFSVGYFL